MNYQDISEWMKNNPGVGVVSIQTMPSIMGFHRIKGRPVLISQNDAEWLTQTFSNVTQTFSNVQSTELTTYTTESNGTQRDATNDSHTLGEEREGMGKEAYESRLHGRKWSWIAKELDRDNLRVLALAKAYAKSHGKTWPVTRSREF